MSEFSQIGNEQKQRVTQIFNQEVRVAKDLSKIKDQNAYDQNLYNVEATIQENAFIDNLFKVKGVQKQFSEQDLSRLENVKERNMSHILLNQHKFLGDSGYMKDVKNTLADLEEKLAEKKTDKDSLDAVEKAYNDAISACSAYVEHKNPWFESGKKRLQKVEERMEKLREERDFFKIGRKAFDVGLKPDGAAVDSPMDILVYGRTRQSRMEKEIPDFRSKYAFYMKMYDDLDENDPRKISKADLDKQFLNHDLFNSIETVKLEKKNSKNDYSDIKNADKFFYTKNLDLIHECRRKVEEKLKELSDPKYDVWKEILDRALDKVEREIEEKDFHEMMVNLIENDKKKELPSTITYPDNLFQHRQKVETTDPMVAMNYFLSYMTEHKYLEDDGYVPSRLVQSYNQMIKTEKEQQEKAEQERKVREWREKYGYK